MRRPYDRLKFSTCAARSPSARENKHSGGADGASADGAHGDKRACAGDCPSCADARISRRRARESVHIRARLPFLRDWAHEPTRAWESVHMRGRLPFLREWTHQPMVRVGIGAHARERLPFLRGWAHQPTARVGIGAHARGITLLARMGESAVGARGNRCACARDYPSCADGRVNQMRAWKSVRMRGRLPFLRGRAHQPSARVGIGVHAREITPLRGCRAGDYPSCANGHISRRRA
jgi:hypothetical protein